MKRIFILASMIVVLAFPATAQTVPAKIKKFLDDYYTSPELGAWKQAPGYCDGRKWILTGDFNGDGRTDYVVRITTGKFSAQKRLHLIGFINTKGDLIPDPFFEDENSGEVLRSSSSIIKRGTTVNLGLGEEGEGPSVILKADAIAQYICQTDASITYVYKNGEFKKIQQEDSSAESQKAAEVTPPASSPTNPPANPPANPTPRPTPYQLARNDRSARSTDLTETGKRSATTPGTSEPVDLTGTWIHRNKDGSPPKEGPWRIRQTGTKLTIDLTNVQVTGSVRGDTFIIDLEGTGVIEQNGNVIRFRNDDLRVREGYNGPIGSGTGIPKIEQRCIDLAQGHVAWNRAGNTNWDPVQLNVLCGATENAEATIDCFKSQRDKHSDLEGAVKACSTIVSLAARADRPLVKAQQTQPASVSDPKPTSTVPDLSGKWTIYSATGAVEPSVGSVSYKGSEIEFEITDFKSRSRATAYVNNGTIVTGWDRTATVSADGRTISWSDGTRWVRR